MQPEARARPPMPRIKVAITEDGGGVSEIEYPKSDRRRHRRADDLRAPRLVLRDHDRRGQLPGIEHGAESAGALLLARPGHPLLRAGRPAPRPPPRWVRREVIQKPDITATDCASNTFFGILAKDGWHFCGSSQAAEHAATIAALMRQTAPLATPAKHLASARDLGDQIHHRHLARRGRRGHGERARGDAKRSAARRSKTRPATSSNSVEEGRKGGGTEANEKKSRHDADADAPARSCGHQGPGALEQRIAADLRIHLDPPGQPSPARSTAARRSRAPRPTWSRRSSPTAATASSSSARTRRAAAASSGIYSFTVDTKVPRAKIVGHPKKLVKTRKRSVVARFRLKASESPVTYYCQFDKRTAADLLGATSSTGSRTASTRSGSAPRISSATSPGSRPSSTSGSRRLPPKRVSIAPQRRSA